MPRKFVFLFSLFFFTVILLKFPKPSFAGYWHVNSYGILIYSQKDEKVLGAVYAKEGQNGDMDDDSSGSGSSGSGSSGSGSSGSSSSGSNSGDFTPSFESGPSSPVGSPDVDTEDEPDELESEPEDGNEDFFTPQQVKTETNGQKTEIRFGEDEKIKTETKMGETKTEVYSSGTKVKIEQKNDRLVIKVENEAGSEIELGEQEIFKIEERMDKNMIKVATASGNAFIVAKGSFAARTNFPLTVDLNTNELNVNTSAGQKVLTVLPDAAVRNLLAANVIDQLDSQLLLTAALQQQLGDLNGVVELGEREGIPVYQINGLSNQKLLGFIPLKIRKLALVSSETGELIQVVQSPLNRFLDILSF